MKNLLSFDEFVNENYDSEGFKPSQEPDVLGKKVETIEEIVLGKEYKIEEKEYLYQGVTNGQYIFNGEDDADVINVNAEELQALITDGKVITVVE